LPEISSIGVHEAEAKAAGHDVVVGRAKFAELARGQISGTQEGMMKLVVDAATRKILGCQILGEGATELVHLAQMAIMTGSEFDMFVEKIFNFPTLAEAYRVAALDIAGQLAARAMANAGGTKA
ncbi:MAG: Si-specific NAD(P)(+) transhydrogenase, partial [Planctomycetes bacterium]|nr:Si-specific NAD(P)(+) transhydrogenase [Planctomycetota bacterium]